MVQTPLLPLTGLSNDRQAGATLYTSPLQSNTGRDGQTRSVCLLDQDKHQGPAQATEANLQYIQKQFSGVGPFLPIFSESRWLLGATQRGWVTVALTVPGRVVAPPHKGR